MSAHAQARPDMVHESVGQFVFGCIFFSAFIALGLFVLWRTEAFHAAYVRWLQRFPYPSKPGPSLGGTRFIGWAFVVVGTFLLAFSIYDQFLR